MGRSGEFRSGVSANLRGSEAAASIDYNNARKAIRHFLFSHLQQHRKDYVNP